MIFWHREECRGHFPWDSYALSLITEHVEYHTKEITRNCEPRKVTFSFIIPKFVSSNMQSKLVTIIEEIFNQLFIYSSLLFRHFPHNNFLLKIANIKDFKDMPSYLSTSQSKHLLLLAWTLTPNLSNSQVQPSMIQMQDTLAKICLYNIQSSCRYPLATKCQIKNQSRICIAIMCIIQYDLPERRSSKIHVDHLTQAISGMLVKIIDKWLLVQTIYTKTIRWRENLFCLHDFKALSL